MGLDPVSVVSFGSDYAFVPQLDSNPHSHCGEKDFGAQPSRRRRNVAVLGTERE